MFSILIPIYNYNVNKLIIKIHDQCKNYKYEIICIDDYSTTEFRRKNKVIINIKNVIYKELEQNIGRSKIRNMLRKEAKYNNMIFLDCDVIIKNDFIPKYMSFIKNNYKNIICGGVEYENQNEKNKNKLRWLYGKKREEKNIKKRNKKPYLSFSSCNFLINKTTFDRTMFDVNMKHYGYEDTAFSIKMKKHKIKVEHINNTVIHLGLIDNKEYLNNIKTSLHNLLYLSRKEKLNFKIIKYYNLIRPIKMIVLFFWKFIERKIECQLIKGENSMIFKIEILFLLDLYKLCNLLKIKNRI